MSKQNEPHPPTFPGVIYTRTESKKEWRKGVYYWVFGQNFYYEDEPIERAMVARFWRCAWQDYAVSLLPDIDMKTDEWRNANKNAEAWRAWEKLK